MLKSAKNLPLSQSQFRRKDTGCKVSFNQSDSELPISDEALSLEKLLSRGAIWQAKEQRENYQTMSTGYQALDNVLHWGGWPQGGLSEILLSQYGIGEVRLVTPLLVRLNQLSGYITWINPPYLPYAPALALNKLDLNRILIVRAVSLDDTIWAAQQALASKACAAVLVWLPDKPLNKAIRKLSLAAKSGNCWGVLFRNQLMSQHPSAAQLRLTLKSTTQGLQEITINKQPGGWSGQQIKLNLFPEKAYWSRLSPHLWPESTVNKSQTPFTESIVTEQMSRFSEKLIDKSQIKPTATNQLAKRFFH